MFNLSDSAHMKHKGFIIAGTHSGCGKTTLTMGLISALRSRGFKVQPFKSGPDYIDPGFHALAAGQTCRNLDTRMMNDSIVLELYKRQIRKADIGIVEGVMGLFDGAGINDERGSAAHLSKVLGLPVLLVIDARAMARSAAALARGFIDFDPDVHVSGFLLNRVGSERHATLLISAIEDATGRPVAGCVFRSDDMSLPDRHLGLVPVWENEGATEFIDRIRVQVGRSLNLDKLLSLAEDTRPLPEESGGLFTRLEAVVHIGKPVIAVARDAAFCFYYQDNLDFLKAAGARLVEFSPLSDQKLPDNTAGIWFGGGYPELHGKALSENQDLLEDIRKSARSSMPMFGECGGYMYLSEAIVDAEKKRYPMAGVLPGTAVMGSKLASLGYCQVSLACDTIFGPAGIELNGHIFHWSKMTDMPEDSRPLFHGIEGGVSIKNVVGSWMHVHFASNPQALKSFVAAAWKWEENRL